MAATVTGQRDPDQASSFIQENYSADIAVAAENWREVVAPPEASSCGAPSPHGDESATAAPLFAKAASGVLDEVHVAQTLLRVGEVDLARINLPKSGSGGDAGRPTDASADSSAGAGAGGAAESKDAAGKDAHKSQQDADVVVVPERSVDDEVALALVEGLGGAKSGAVAPRSGADADENPAADDPGDDFAIRRVARELEILASASNSAAVPGCSPDATLTLAARRRCVLRVLHTSYRQEHTHYAALWGSVVPSCGIIGVTEASTPSQLAFRLLAASLGGNGMLAKGKMERARPTTETVALLSHAAALLAGGQTSALSLASQLTAQSVEVFERMADLLLRVAEERPGSDLAALLPRPTALTAALRLALALGSQRVAVAVACTLAKLCDERGDGVALEPDVTDALRLPLSAMAQLGRDSAASYVADLVLLVANHEPPQGYRIVGSSGGISVAVQRTSSRAHALRAIAVLSDGVRAPSGARLAKVLMPANTPIETLELNRVALQAVSSDSDAPITGVGVDVVPSATRPGSSEYEEAGPAVARNGPKLAVSRDDHASHGPRVDDGPQDAPEEEQSLNSLLLVETGGEYDVGATNHASISVGSETFASSHERGAGSNHSVVNNGSFGNGQAWRPRRGARGTHFVGIRLPAPILLRSIAWGRDNGQDPQTDRWEGTYTVQCTTSSRANAGTPDDQWHTIDEVTYSSAWPELPFSRHRYDLLRPVECSAVRIVVSSKECAIDEIELYDAVRDISSEVDAASAPSASPPDSGPEVAAGVGCSAGSAVEPADLHTIQSVVLSFGIDASVSSMDSSLAALLTHLERLCRPHLPIFRDVHGAKTSLDKVGAALATSHVAEGLAGSGFSTVIPLQVDTCYGVLQLLSQLLQWHLDRLCGAGGRTDHDRACAVSGLSCVMRIAGVAAYRLSCFGTKWRQAAQGVSDEGSLPTRAQLVEDDNAADDGLLGGAEESKSHAGEEGHSDSKESVQERESKGDDSDPGKTTGSGESASALDESLLSLHSQLANVAAAPSLSAAVEDAAVVALLRHEARRSIAAFPDIGLTVRLLVSLHSSAVETLSSEQKSLAIVLYNRIATPEAILLLLRDAEASETPNGAGARTLQELSVVLMDEDGRHRDDEVLGAARVRALNAVCGRVAARYCDVYLRIKEQLKGSGAAAEAQDYNPLRPAFSSMMKLACGAVLREPGHFGQQLSLWCAHTLQAFAAIDSDLVCADDMDPGVCRVTSELLKRASETWKAGGSVEGEVARVVLPAQRVVETAHPYADSMDSITVEHAGASEMSVEFAPQCRLRNGYHFLDVDAKVAGDAGWTRVASYTGANGWKTLTIAGDTVCFSIRTSARHTASPAPHGDGDVAAARRWGFRARVSANAAAHLVNPVDVPGDLARSFVALSCAVALARIREKASSKTAADSDLLPWLESRLLAGGLPLPGQDRRPSEMDAARTLLSELCKGIGPGLQVHDAVVQCLPMSRIERAQYKRSSAEVHAAVRSTAAAILHLTGNVRDAMAMSIELSAGSGDESRPALDVSTKYPSLIASWTKAERIRAWVRAKRVKDGRAVSDLCAEVISRAAMLLDVEPTWSNLPALFKRQLSVHVAERERGGGGGDGFEAEQDALSGAPPPLPPAAAGKTTLPTDIPEPLELGRGLSRLDSVEAKRSRFFIRVWQNMSRGGKSSLRAAVYSSLSTSVLAFVQSNAVSSERVRQAMHKRQRVGASRTIGWSRLVALMRESARYPPAREDLLRQISAGLSSDAHAQLIKHCSNGLEGAGPVAMLNVQEAATGTLDQILRAVELSMGSRLGAESGDGLLDSDDESESVAHVPISIVVGAMSAWKTELKPSDADRLVSLRIIPRLAKLSQLSRRAVEGVLSSRDHPVAAAARRVLALIARTVVLPAGEIDPSTVTAATTISRQLLEFLSADLNSYLDAVESARSSSASVDQRCAALDIHHARAASALAILGTVATMGGDAIREEISSHRDSGVVKTLLKVAATPAPGCASPGSLAIRVLVRLGLSKKPILSPAASALAEPLVNLLFSLVAAPLLGRTIPLPLRRHRIPRGADSVSQPEVRLLEAARTPPGRSRGAAAFVNKHLYVFGGVRNGGSHDSELHCCRIPRVGTRDLKWKQVLVDVVGSSAGSRLPPTYGCCASAHNGRMYVFGGVVDGHAVNSLWEIEPSSETKATARRLWPRVLELDAAPESVDAEGPTPRCESACAVIGGMLVVAGGSRGQGIMSDLAAGRDNSLCDDVWVWLFAQRRWAPLSLAYSSSSRPPAVACAQLCADPVENCLWLSGGERIVVNPDGTRVRRDGSLWCLRLLEGREGEWDGPIVGADAPTLHRHTAAFYGGNLLAVTEAAPLPSGEVPQSHLHSFDVVSRSWKHEARMPTSCWGSQMALALDIGCALVFGGRDEGRRLQTNSLCRIRLPVSSVAAAPPTTGYAAATLASEAASALTSMATSEHWAPIVGPRIETSLRKVPQLLEVLCTRPNSAIFEEGTREQLTIALASLAVFVPNPRVVPGARVRISPARDDGALATVSSHGTVVRAGPASWWARVVYDARQIAVRDVEFGVLGPQGSDESEAQNATGHAEGPISVAVPGTLVRIDRVSGLPRTDEDTPPIFPLKGVEMISLFSAVVAPPGASSSEHTSPESGWLSSSAYVAAVASAGCASDVEITASGRTLAAVSALRTGVLGLLKYVASDDALASYFVSHGPLPHLVRVATANRPPTGPTGQIESEEAVSRRHDVLSDVLAMTTPRRGRDEVALRGDAVETAAAATDAEHDTDAVENDDHRPVADSGGGGGGGGESVLGAAVAQSDRPASSDRGRAEQSAPSASPPSDTPRGLPPRLPMIAVAHCTRIFTTTSIPHAVSVWAPSQPREHAGEVAFFAHPVTRGRRAPAEVSGLDISTEECKALVARPRSFRRVWLSPATSCCLWEPIAPRGFSALGLVGSASGRMPDTTCVWCIRTQFTRRTNIAGRLTSNTGVRHPLVLWGVNSATRGAVFSSVDRSPNRALTVLEDVPTWAQLQTAADDGAAASSTASGSAVVDEASARTDTIRVVEPERDDSGGASEVKEEEQSDTGVELADSSDVVGVVQDDYGLSGLISDMSASHGIEGYDSRSYVELDGSAEAAAAAGAAGMHADQPWSTSGHRSRSRGSGVVAPAASHVLLQLERPDGSTGGSVQQSQLWSSLAGCEDANAAAAARRGVLTLLSRWPSSVPFVHSSLASSLLHLLKLAHAAGSRVRNQLQQALVAQLSTSSGALADDIGEAVAGSSREYDAAEVVSTAASDSSGALGVDLGASLARSVAEETVALLRSTSLAGVQPRSQESDHPYPNSHSSTSRVTMRGATALRVVFDRRCSLETNCDVLTIHRGASTRDDARVRRCSCRRDARDWAAHFGPLDVAGDTLTWSFETDSTNNDWGWKFTVYPVGLAACDDALLSEADRLLRPSASMAMWVVQLLADSNSASFTTLPVMRALLALARSTAVGQANAFGLLAQLLQRHARRCTERCTAIETGNDDGRALVLLPLQDVKWLEPRVNRLAESEASIVNSRGVYSRVAQCVAEASLAASVASRAQSRLVSLAKRSVRAADNPARSRYGHTGTAGAGTAGEGDGPGEPGRTLLALARELGGAVEVSSLQRAWESTTGTPWSASGALGDLHAYLLTQRRFFDVIEVPCGSATISLAVATLDASRAGGSDRTVHFTDFGSVSTDGEAGGSGEGRLDDGAVASDSARPDRLLSSLWLMPKGDGNVAGRRGRIVLPMESVRPGSSLSVLLSVGKDVVGEVCLVICMGADPSRQASSRARIRVPPVHLTNSTNDQRTFSVTFGPGDVPRTPGKYSIQYWDGPVPEGSPTSSSERFHVSHGPSAQALCSTVTRWRQVLLPRLRFFEAIAAVLDVHESSGAGTLQGHPGTVMVEEVEVTREMLTLHPLLESVPTAAVHEGIRHVLSFNGAMGQLHPFVDPAWASQSWSMSSSAYALRALLRHQEKVATLTTVLAASETSGGRLSIMFNRAKAGSIATQANGTGEGTMFHQALVYLSDKPASALRKRDRVWEANFAGEGSQDAGGPYRESVDCMAAELQSVALPLFIPSPNARNNVGASGRDTWVVNSRTTTDLSLRMFDFLGKFLGIAIRTRHYLALNLPALFWKQLIGESASIDDLAEVDSATAEMLCRVRDCGSEPAAHGIADDGSDFSEVFQLDFTVPLSDGTKVELIPGGAGRPVTWSERGEYVRLALAARLDEAPAAMSAIRAGLETQVPLGVLRMFTWRQVELLVCGRTEVDLELLRANTTYSSDAFARSATVAHLWKALESFSHDERSLFLRFVWGRSRLPLSSSEFDRQFRVDELARTSGPEGRLPVSHTCFFSIEWPHYPNARVAAAKLRYAIVHCRAIDGDFAPASRDAWRDLESTHVVG